MFDHRVRQIFNVGCRQIQAFGPCRWHDMPGVSGQEHAPKTQRLGDKAAQRRDALFDGRTGDQFRAALFVKTQAQFLPERVVGPLADPVGERHLQVIAAACFASL